MTASKGAGPEVKWCINGKRRTVLVLTPEELIAFFLKLPPATILSAVAEAAAETNPYRGEVYDLSVPPEIIKQLATGAIAAQQAEGDANARTVRR